LEIQIGCSWFEEIPHRGSHIPGRSDNRALYIVMLRPFRSTNAVKELDELDLSTVFIGNRNDPRIPDYIRIPRYFLNFLTSIEGSRTTRGADTGIFLFFCFPACHGPKNPPGRASMPTRFVAENIVNKIIGNKIYNSIVLPTGRREKKIREVCTIQI
jgi:hypothetical protein